MSLQWASEAELDGDSSYTFTNLYRSGAPSEAVRITADAAFGALATWLGEQQRLVERAFEARAQPAHGGAASCSTQVQSIGCGRLL